MKKTPAERALNLLIAEHSEETHNSLIEEFYPDGNGPSPVSLQMLRNQYKIKTPKTTEEIANLELKMRIVRNPPSISDL